MDSDKFVGRREELKRLRSLLKKKSSSLVVIRGRRRIGKSRLVEEFAKHHKFFAFAGIPPSAAISAQDQRNIFAEQLGKQIGIPGIQSTDWSALFSLLAKETLGQEVVVLLDEISWMGSKDPLFLGKLKNAWDLEFKKNPNLILVLCGSVSTWIEENIISSTAFFGRISLNLKLEELPLIDCHKFLLSTGFRGSTYEEFKILSVTGGVPWYLEQIQKGCSADDNLRNICFRADGVLFNEFKAIFHDLFEKRSAIYEPIVQILASGSLDFNQICNKLKYPKSGTLSEYLNDLIQSGFVSRDFIWGIKSGKPSQLSRYRLSDNYLRFYLKHMQPYCENIRKGDFSKKPITSLPGWNTVMGLQFENLVLKNRDKVFQQLGIRPEDVLADNPFFQKATAQRKGCQIDYLIQTRFNTLFACEIKFSTHPIKSDVIRSMKQKIQSIVIPKRFSCWPVLIHVNGACDAVRDKDYFAQIIDFSSFLNPRSFLS